MCAPSSSSTVNSVARRSAAKAGVGLFVLVADQHARAELGEQPRRRDTGPGRFTDDGDPLSDKAPDEARVTPFGYAASILFISSFKVASASNASKIEINQKRMTIFCSFNPFSS